MIEIKKKENESAQSHFFRFSKKVRQSGVLAEVRKRRFHSRTTNRRARRLSAVYRVAKRAETARQKKLGVL